jgi:hypothetical protein
MESSRHPRIALVFAVLLVAAMACRAPGAATPTATIDHPAQTLAAQATIDMATVLASQPGAGETPVLPPPEATFTPTPTITHLMRPDDPGPYVDSFMTDISSEILAPEHRSIGDNFSWSDYERPFTTDVMDYQPYLDITRGELRVIAPWMYVTIFMVDPIPADATATYSVEIDLDLDGGGDWLVSAALPLTTEWTTDGVRVYHDHNDDVGRPSPLWADPPPQLTDGYDELVFDQGIGDDPDAAWARIAPGNPDRIQIAFKHSLIALDTHLLWGVWADGLVNQPGWFDYNDHFTIEEAGSPLSTSPDYPLQALASLDNSCRWTYDFEPTEQLPGMCALPPTPVPPGSIAGRVFLDMNHNNIRDGADSVLAGATVTLRSGGCGGSVVATTTTLLDGTYSFTNVGAGDYCVTVTPADTCGLCDGFCDVPGQVNPRPVTLAGGENKTGVDFIFYQQGPC